MGVERHVPVVDVFGFFEQAGRFDMMLEKFQHLFIVIGSHRFGVPLDTEYFFFRMLHRFVDPVGSCRRSDKFGSRLFDCLVMKRVDQKFFFTVQHGAELRGAFVQCDGMGNLFAGKRLAVFQ